MKRRKYFTVLMAATGAALTAAVMTASPASADTQGTTTDLILPNSQVVFGFESSFTMQVDISSAFEGSWSITAGSPTLHQTVPLCGGSLPATTSCSIPAGALSVGNWNLIAVYSGSENFSPSASGLVPLQVIAQEPTTTSLTLSPSTVIAGQEQSEDMVFGVAGNFGHAGVGPVTVLAASTQPGSTPVPLSQCTNIGLDVFGFNDCSLNPSELQPGTYQLTASFGGSQNFAGSTSAPQTLTVLGQQTTTTSLRLSAGSVPFGNEQTETLTATVTPATSGIPTGHVTVTSGSTPVCTIFLASGTSQCTLTASQLTPGSYPLTATYSGDNLDLTSTDTSQTLTVAKDPTATSLQLSADTIARGSEQAELFTVQVAPTISSTIPTGNVAVKAGATAVCTIVLANGTGTCKLTKNQLAVGTHQMTATYNGDATYATSTSSPPQTLTVNKAGSGIAIGGPAGAGRSRPLIWGLPS